MIAVKELYWKIFATSATEMSHFVFQSDSSDTTISNVTLVENHVQKHIHLIHEGYKDHECDSCGKSFFHSHWHNSRSLPRSQIPLLWKSIFHEHNLKNHINSIHEGSQGGSNLVRMAMTIKHVSIVYYI